MVNNDAFFCDIFVFLFSGVQKLLVTFSKTSLNNITFLYVI